MRTTSASHFILSASFLTEATNSATDRALKNLFVRLYSGFVARVSGVSVGDATWKTDRRMSMSYGIANKSLLSSYVKRYTISLKPLQVMPLRQRLHGSCVAKKTQSLAFGRDSCGLAA